MVQLNSEPVIIKPLLVVPRLSTAPRGAATAEPVIIKP